jgi:hypothetical protein
MEKREERKKEALARLEHSKKHQSKEKDVKASDGDTVVSSVIETVEDKDQKSATEVSDSARGLPHMYGCLLFCRANRFS